MAFFYKFNNVQSKIYKKLSKVSEDLEKLDEEVKINLETSEKPK